MRIFLMAAALVAVAASGASPAATPIAFLDDLYAHYRNSAFCPTCDGTAGRIFDASLVALIRKDEKLADGEVGSLDGDPVCDCQDPGGMKAKVLSVASSGASAAAAKVELRFPDGPRQMTLDLVLTKDGWRIHDTHTKDTPSLRKLLEDGIALMSKAHK